MLVVLNFVIKKLLRNINKSQKPAQKYTSIFFRLPLNDVLYCINRLTTGIAAFQSCILTCEFIGGGGSGLFSEAVRERGRGCCFYFEVRPEEGRGGGEGEVSLLLSPPPPSLPMPMVLGANDKKDNLE